MDSEKKEGYLPTNCANMSLLLTGNFSFKAEKM